MEFSRRALGSTPSMKLEYRPMRSLGCPLAIALTALAKATRLGRGSIQDERGLGKHRDGSKGSNGHASMVLDDTLTRSAFIAESFLTIGLYTMRRRE